MIQGGLKQPSIAEAVEKAPRVKFLETMIQKLGLRRIDISGGATISLRPSLFSPTWINLLRWAHVMDIWGVGHGLWMRKFRVVESRICSDHGGFGLGNERFSVLDYATMTKKVLIDLSVRKDAITHLTVLEKTISKWGDDSFETEVAVRKPFPPRSDENFRVEQLPYVAALPKLVSAGHIQLFRSMELVMEDARNIRRDRGYLGLDVLEEVPIGSVEPPVPRTVVFAGLSGSVGTTKEEQIAFFKSIADKRFCEIRRALDDGKGRDPHIGDAYHFWTAEHAGLDIYLTTDRAFIHVFEHQAANKINPRAKVMSPKQLCQSFGVGPKNIEQLARENPPFA